MKFNTMWGFEPMNFWLCVSQLCHRNLLKSLYFFFSIALDFCHYVSAFWRHEVLMIRCCECLRHSSHQRDCQADQHSGEIWTDTDWEKTQVLKTDSSPTTTRNCNIWRVCFIVSGIFCLLRVLLLGTLVLVSLVSVMLLLNSLKHPLPPHHKPADRQSWQN